MKKTSGGFTLIEMIVAIAVMAILMAIALPSFRAWQRSADYRAASRLAASVMMDARGRAVSANREHRVTFTLDGGSANTANSYIIDIGNRSANSSAWTPLPGEVSGTFNAGVDIRGKKDCTQTNGTVVVIFSPKGAAPGANDDSYLCIMDNGGAKVFTTGVTDANTGRVATD